MHSHILGWHILLPFTNLVRMIPPEVFEKTTFKPGLMVGLRQRVGKGYDVSLCMKTEPGRWISDGLSSHVKGLRSPKNMCLANILPFISLGSNVSRAEQVLGHQGINY